MSSLDQEKVNKFIQKNNEKTNEEILEIFNVRHKYQPEAAEAVIKIAIERQLIDENSDEIKQELDHAEEWYYELNGKRHGSVAYSEIKRLIKDKVLSNDNLVWKKGFSDWVKIEETELEKLIPADEPPPLTGDKVNNIFIWILAFAPIIGKIIEVELFPNGSLFFWFLLNSGLAILDDLMLKRAGHKTNNLVWALFIVPVYIWRRSNITKQSKSYFWVWIVCALISLFIY